MTVVWTETALEHIAGIKRYIAQTSQLYAELTVRRILGRGKQLDAFPESGRVVPEVGRPEIREVIEQPYRVMYRVLPDRVEVRPVGPHDGAGHTVRGHLGEEPWVAKGGEDSTRASNAI